MIFAASLAINIYTGTVVISMPRLLCLQLMQPGSAAMARLGSAATDPKQTPPRLAAWMQPRPAAAVVTEA